MALLFNFFSCSVLLYSASHCLSILPIENQVYPYPGVKLASPSLLNICADVRRQVMSRKIICIICKGFDPSCFHNKSSTAAPTTSTGTTTTETPTTNMTTTMTTTTTTKKTEANEEPQE